MQEAILRLLVFGKILGFAFNCLVRLAMLDVRLLITTSRVLEG